MTRPLVVLAGPTAAGKSDLALEIAERVGGTIVSADSRQVYREFDIGTAKPTAADRARAPHECVDIAAPTETYTVARYQEDARAAIARAHGNGRLPLLVGGTGFYIRAVLGGTPIPRVPPDPERRSWLMRQPDLWERLRDRDPDTARRLHPHDRFRLARALEVVEATGRTLASFKAEASPYRAVFLVASASLADLEARISGRVDRMLEAGWMAEVEGLATRYGPDLPLLGTLGYAELLQVRGGSLRLEEARSRIVRHTRQYARRQLAWFRSERGAVWLDPSVHGKLKGWIDAALSEIRPLVEAGLG